MKTRTLMRRAKNAIRRHRWILAPEFKDGRRIRLCSITDDAREWSINWAFTECSLYPHEIRGIQKILVRIAKTTCQYDMDEVIRSLQVHMMMDATYRPVISDQ